MRWRWLWLWLWQRQQRWPLVLLMIGGYSVCGRPCVGVNRRMRSQDRSKAPTVPCVIRPRKNGGRSRVWASGGVWDGVWWLGWDWTAGMRVDRSIFITIGPPPPPINPCCPISNRGRIEAPGKRPRTSLRRQSAASISIPSPQESERSSSSRMDPPTQAQATTAPTAPEEALALVPDASSSRPATKQPVKVLYCIALYHTALP